MIAMAPLGAAATGKGCECCNAWRALGMNMDLGYLALLRKPCKSVSSDSSGGTCILRNTRDRTSLKASITRSHISPYATIARNGAQLLN